MRSTWRRRVQLGRVAVLAVAFLGLGGPAGGAPDAGGGSAAALPDAADQAPRGAVAPRLLSQVRLGALAARPSGRHLRGGSRIRPAAGLPEVRLAEPGPLHAPVEGALRLEFSRPMDFDSVQRSFRIEPAAEGTFEWPDDHTLVFRPSSALAYQATYHVAVGGFPLGRGNLTALGSFTFATVWRPPAVPFPFTLTFDDCGTAEAIQAILSALADRSLHAIFFPTGQCRDQFPWLVPTLLAAGHRVCNHTYSHPDLSKLSSAAIRTEIEGGVSVGCDLFRPPYGALDRAGRVASVAASLGYRLQLWDVDTRDWAGTPADVMVAMIRARGGIVLMHMHGAHTVEAIRKL